MEIEETRDPSRGDWWTPVDGKIEIVRVVQTVGEAPFGGIFFRGDRLGNNIFRKDERVFWGPIPKFVPPTEPAEAPRAEPASETPARGQRPSMDDVDPSRNERLFD